MAESKLIADRVKPKTVDAYIALFPEADQAALHSIRATLRDALPDSEESISYNMPLVSQRGPVMFFAVFKQHYSLFVPAIDRVVEAFGAEVTRYPIHKATIKLPKSEPVPLELIRRIAVFVAGENAAEKTNS